MGDAGATGNYTTMETAGVVPSATGATALIGGIVLAVSNAHSGSKQTLTRWLLHAPRQSEMGWLRMSGRDEGALMRWQLSRRR